MVSSPKPPDPYKQASAQQSAELGASQASAIINNPNQVNPYGTQTNKVIGWETVYDAKGKPMKVPRYETTTTLSKEQQGLLNLQNQTMSNLGQLGVSQSQKLQGLLAKPMDTSGIQGWQTYAKAPQLQTGYNAGGNIASGFGDAGKLAKSFAGGGNILSSIKGAGQGVTSSYGGPTSIAGAGNIQKSIGSGGAIRQDQGATDRTAIERAMMDRYSRDATKTNAAQDAQLAARGMNPGAQQYSQIGEERARDRTDAVNQAYLASGAESRAAQEAYNAAQQQRFGQGAQQGEFANAAQAQQYGQNAASAQFAADQAAQRAGFANAAQQQAFTQNAANAQFGNAAQQQQFGQNQAQAEFGNAAQSQQFQEMLARAGFGNAAQAQRNQQNAQQAQFGNASTQQNYQNTVNWSDLMNNMRSAQMSERTNLRNQPLNEIAALMSGSQVTTPQFQPFSRQGVNAAPVGQYIGQNYANQANAAASQNQGLFGLGGSIMSMFGGGMGAGGMFSNMFSSDRRLKEDIVPVDGTLAGCQLYSFRYIGMPDTRIGVMADEVRLIHPDAVEVDADGYDMVNYWLLHEREAGHAHAA